MSIDRLENFVREEVLNLEKLSEDLRSFNLFDVLGVGHQEIQHSNFLAWLLNPKQSHGIGNYFLKSFINELTGISSTNRIQWMLSDLEKVTILREWKNIDILIKSRDPDFVICIENKSRKQTGKSGDDQLVKYAGTVDQYFLGEFDCAFVYLTPFSRILKDNEVALGWENVTYQWVSKTLEGILNDFELTDDVKEFIHGYWSNMNKNILMSDKSIDLAREIYQRHKSAIDFIVNNKPVIWSNQLFTTIQKHIDSDPELVLLTPRSKDIIRFLPKSVHPIFQLPINAWADRNLLFAIEIFINDSSIWFKFCFGAINSKKDDREKHQEIKNRFYWAMKEFESLKNYTISSGPKYQYPSVAYYTLFKISETKAVDANGFLEFFKERFEGFKANILAKWEQEVKENLS